MFYNFLHHSGSGTRRDTIPEDIPADRRNVLQQEMIYQYQPDVVAGQELPHSKRRDVGFYDIALLLSDISYKETMDPRVCNIQTEIYGRGGKPFRVGQNTCYTRCNASPLFYNTKTTKCLKTDYYLFEHHFDEDYPHKSAGEAASKALTWGVFESKKTKERYIVISAHMSWGGGKFILRQQAEEVVALISKLVAKYPYPIFFGGDINGNRGSQNYDHFIEVGYTDIQDHAVATEFSSKVLPDKGYPCINQELGFMVPDKVHLRYISDELHKNGIDHIFMPDPSNVDVKVFGVIVDECSLSASDHLPIFADFNLKK
jgi:endonuclease/exonuclease/phosphatase family metal-dependent hydrolase